MACHSLDVLLQDANALRAEECYLREWDGRLADAIAELLSDTVESRDEVAQQLSCQRRRKAWLRCRELDCHGQFVSMALAMVMMCGVG
jgi:hypothetical protein